MRFIKTNLKDAFIIEPDRKYDKRGFFAHLFDATEFAKKRFESKIEYLSMSFNKKKGTLRGMHFQLSPYQETKIVRCCQGAIYDVIIDLRKRSPTYKKHFGVKLTSKNRLILYVPKGFAHGFMTLTDNTEVNYLVSAVYKPTHARGIRYNDPTYAIKWPGKVRVISERDKNYPDFYPI